MTGGEHARNSSQPAKKLTYGDFVRFPDDGKRHELIDGEHYVTPSPTTKHQQVLVELVYLLRSHLEAHPTGEIFAAPYDVVLSDHDVVEPDVLYFSNVRARQVITPLHARGAPELVVEILSPGTRKVDETTKRSLYERAGVSEYWTIDPDLETIRVYRRTGPRFDPGTDLSRESGVVLETQLLPGFRLPIEAVFKRR